MNVKKFALACLFVVFAALMPVLAFADTVDPTMPYRRTQSPQPDLFGIVLLVIALAGLAVIVAIAIIRRRRNAAEKASSEQADAAKLEEPGSDI